MSQPSRQLGGLAVAQLAAWRTYASKWYWHLERRDTDNGHRLGEGTEQYHAICGSCDTSMAVLSSEGIGYLMNNELMLDAVTRHLRNQHRGIEAGVYGYGENTQAGTGARGHSDTNGSGTNPGGLQTKE